MLRVHGELFDSAFTSPGGPKGTLRCLRAVGSGGGTRRQSFGLLQSLTMDCSVHPRHVSEFEFRPYDRRRVCRPCGSRAMSELGLAGGNRVRRSFDLVSAANAVPFKGIPGSRF